MTCACIKANGFNLELSGRDCNTIILEDFSRWVYSELEGKPNTFTINLKSLDRGVEKSFEIKTDCKNILTSEDIFGKELSCIPDGLFCITTEMCGIKYTILRTFLRNSEIELLKLVANYSDDLDEEILSVIEDSKYLIESIKINTELGNLENSSKLFRKLKKKLKSFNCDKC